MVEHLVANENVAGSNPVIRSLQLNKGLSWFRFCQDSMKTQPVLWSGRDAKRLLQPINADYDVVAEAEAILADAVLAAA